MRQHAQRLMRNERRDHTLQASALVNEACLKLMQEGAIETAENRKQLFYASIRAMRQVLTDHARSRLSLKRGGQLQRQPLDDVLQEVESTHQVPYLDLDVALERLAAESSRQYETLCLRFFAGLTIAQTSEMMECSESTVEADWRLARAKLLSWLE
ncbi:MAG: ECF-type sigma factor [Pirellulaceae bacterium]